MKLWDKGQATAEKVELFTVGNDRDFDLLLAPFDCKASKAHATMLANIGLLTAVEVEAINLELDKIFTATQNGSFTIRPEAEDVHSELEIRLVEALGEVGKKIHSGRSRNDQVLTALKLFLRDANMQIVEQIGKLAKLLLQLSDQHKAVLMPGYTHLQVAMPSSFGLWFGAYAEALVDDLYLFQAAYKVANKNPLGSAAGYGSSFPLNRELTTQLMGFEEPNINAIYAQMTRGKTERLLATAIAGVAATLSRLAMDMCLYNSQNFAFVSFPAAFTTGSSIMPHKKNPDVFELVRGKCNKLQALPSELAFLMSNLPSGYHREMQLTKESIFPAISTISDCLDMTCLMLENIEVKHDLLKEVRYADCFSVERVNELVLGGVPFRDAYKQVGKELTEGKNFANTNLNHAHLGSIGNLGNDLIAKRLTNLLSDFV